MKRILKITVSAVLIGVLLWQLDWREFGQQLRNLDPWLITLAVVLLSIQYPISAWKWQKALEANGLTFEFGFLLRVLLIAFFFNNFFPSAIGGDAYRVWRTAEAGEAKVPPIAAVLLERLTGLAALICIGLASAAVLLYQDRLLDPELISLGLILAVGGLLILWVAYRVRSLHWLWDKLTQVEKVRPLVKSMRTMKRDAPALVKLVLLSFLFQITAVIAIACVFGALDVHNVLVESGFAATASGVASVLPISVNGIGVVEGSFVLAALECSLPYASAIAVALFLRLYIVAASVICGLLYAFEPKTVREMPTGESV